MTETEQEFIRTNSPVWKTLEAETEFFNKRTTRLKNKLSKNALTKERVDRYIELYNQAANHLAYCRTFWGETDTAAYLNRLVGAAHAVIYAKTVFSIKDVFRYIAQGFPRLFRSEIWFFVAALAAFMLPGLIAYIYVRVDARNALAFMSEQELAGIRQEGQYDAFSAIKSTVDGMYIGSNNIIVCIEAFAGGFTFGLFTLYVLVQNGLLLGALGGYCGAVGRGAFFWSLIVPHGVTELFAIFLSGMAGLMVGYAMLNPGRLKWGTAVLRAGKKAVKLLVIGILLLIPSAVIESFFTPLDIPYIFKFLFALTMLILLVLYLCVGIGKDEKQKRTDAMAAGAYPEVQSL